MPGIAGILLAAGRGVRFGGNKLLHVLDDGVPVGAAAARTLLAAVPDSVAVIHPADSAFARVLESIGLRWVACPDSERGMGASFACGVRATIDADGWVVALADMPFVQPATIGAVVERLTRGAALVAPTHHGQRGHPVGFNARYRTELMALDGDRGAREILIRDADRMEQIVVEDPGVLRDIDTSDDVRG